jgi:hypothetical protein
MWPGLSSNASQIGSAVSLNCHDAPDRLTKPATTGGSDARQREKHRLHRHSALRYRDGAAVIDWLCRAFGFERHLLVPGDLP